MATLFCIT